MTICPDTDTGRRTAGAVAGAMPPQAAKSPRRAEATRVVALALYLFTPEHSEGPDGTRLRNDCPAAPRWDALKSVVWVVVSVASSLLLAGRCSP